MNLIDSFLIFTIISYFVAVIISLKNPVVRNMPRYVDSLLMFINGGLLIGNLIFDIPILWFFYGVWWSLAAGLSFLGYVTWNIKYLKEPSSVHQVTMFVWDALIAVICLSKF